MGNLKFLGAGKVFFGIKKQLDFQVSMKLLIQALSKDARLKDIPLDEHRDFLLDLALGKRQGLLTTTTATTDHAKELVALAYGMYLSLKYI